MRAVIVDYGLSNLGSIGRAVEECETYPIITNNPSDLNSATHIILPGVGAFHDGMKNLKEMRMDKAIINAVVNEHIPFLGICLGMQLMATVGLEGGEYPGLNLISGKIIKIIPKINTEKVPHVGWNDLKIKKKSTILADIPDKTDFYFVHSYHFAPDYKNTIVATTDFAGGIVSVINRENIFGVQFHPEKSQFSGLRILKNFLSINQT